MADPRAKQVFQRNNTDHGVPVIGIDDAETRDAVFGHLVDRGPQCFIATDDEWPGVTVGRRQIGAHHFVDEEQLERIDGILAAEMIAAALHLLGENRPLQGEHREAVRNGAGDQEREEGVQVVRQLDGKDDARER